LSAFHVTLPREVERIHFYYHEYLENEWEPAGHTSRPEILRLGCDPLALREAADEVAAALVAALGGVFRARG
jgi:hypothetical protein